MKPDRCEEKRGEEVSGSSRIPRRGAGANPAIQRKIGDCVRSDITSAAEVRRILLGAFAENAVPSERTIHDMVKEIVRRYPPARWTIAQAKLEQLAIVFPVWALAVTKGRGLTQAEADWVERIRIVTPDLSLDDVWRLASERVLWPGSEEWIDPLLAYAPYRDVEHRERYFANASRIFIPFDAIAVALGSDPSPTQGPKTREFLRRVGYKING